MYFPVRKGYCGYPRSRPPLRFKTKNLQLIEPVDRVTGNLLLNAMGRGSHVQMRAPRPTFPALAVPIQSNMELDPF